MEEKTKQEKQQKIESQNGRYKPAKPTLKNHKEKFDQLLDDAVLGVKKK